MALDPRHVTLLLSIAEAGSFSAAAVALNTSQPALSNRIAALERELGAKVFERTRHGVKPTEVGLLLLRHARAVQAVLAQARREVDLKKRGADGPLAVGTTPMPAYELIPKALAELAGLRIALSVVEELDEVLIERLETYELDLVVATLGLERLPSSFHQELLVELPFVAVVGVNHKLAHRRAVSLRDLDNMQWALPSPGGAFRRYIEAIFLNNGVPIPQDAWTFSSAVSLKGAVQHAGCISILPRHFVRSEQRAGALKVLQLTDPSPARPIGLIYLRSRSLSPIAERFRQAVRQVAKSIR